MTWETVAQGKQQPIIDFEFCGNVVYRDLQTLTRNKIRFERRKNSRFTFDWRLGTYSPELMTNWWPCNSMDSGLEPGIMLSVAHWWLDIGTLPVSG